MRRRGRPLRAGACGMPLEERVLLAIHLLRMRLNAQLTQREAARRSGIGEKTISSFESGVRTQGIRVSHLAKLCAVYETRLSAFFAEIETDAERHRRRM